ncbi:hypothetical protein B0H19DRAFT_1341096, partial [Mycena capillaripes]
FTTVRTFCISVGQHGAILLDTINGLNFLRLFFGVLRLRRVPPPILLGGKYIILAWSKCWAFMPVIAVALPLLLDIAAPFLFLPLPSGSSGHSTPFRKNEGNHNNGQPRSAQHRIHAFELPLSVDESSNLKSFIGPSRWRYAIRTSHHRQNQQHISFHRVGRDLWNQRPFLLELPFYCVSMALPKASPLALQAPSMHTRARTSAPLGVALPDSLRAARAFTGAQGNAEAREQARLGMCAPQRRLASARVIDLRIPPGPPKLFGSRIATNKARHDTVHICTRTRAAYAYHH